MMLSKYVDTSTLHTLPIFEGMSFEKLLPYVDIVYHPKASYLFYAGDKPDGLYILLDGVVKVTYINPNGDEKIISLFERGDIFGALFLGKHRNRVGTGYTLSDINAAKISERDFVALTHDFPQFSLNFIRHLVDDQRETLARMHTLMHLDAHHRLLGTLVYLARHYCCRNGDWAQLPTFITQEDIATIACVNRSTASLLINQLRKQGILGGKGRVLTIHRAEIEALLARNGVEILL